MSLPRSSIAIRGVYAVTPDIEDTKQLLTLVEASLKGGVSLLQYRNKRADSRLRNQQSQKLLTLCREYGVPLIINDSVKLCLALDADGVHLGETDGPLVAARERLGDKLLGASCYNDWGKALAAERAGADYVAFGACFSSSTKPLAVKADLVHFTQPLSIPKVAIGGITEKNAIEVIRAGANAIAVVGGLYQAQDVEHQARLLAACFPTH